MYYINYSSFFYSPFQDFAIAEFIAKSSKLHNFR